jgi:hypothetical protein
MSEIVERNRTGASILRSKRVDMYVCMYVRTLVPKTSQHNLHRTYLSELIKGLVPFVSALDHTRVYYRFMLQWQTWPRAGGASNLMSFVGLQRVRGSLIMRPRSTHLHTSDWLDVTSSICNGAQVRYAWFACVKWVGWLRIFFVARLRFLIYIYVILNDTTSCMFFHSSESYRKFHFKGETVCSLLFIFKKNMNRLIQGWFFTFYKKISGIRNRIENWYEF